MMGVSDKQGVLRPMEDPMTFDNRGGGSVTVERGFVQDPRNAGFAESVMQGTPVLDRQAEKAFAQERQLAGHMRQLSQNFAEAGGVDNRSMYQRHATPEQIARATENKRLGTATLDDALALGDRRSRYGDFGSVREEVGDSRMIRGPYGGGAREDSTRMRSRDMGADEWMERTFNAPARQAIADSQAAEKEMAVRNKPINTQGGLYDPVTGKIIEGTGPQGDQRGASQYNVWQGSATILLDDNTVGVWNTKGNYYDPTAIRDVPVWATGADGFSQQEMRPNYDREGIATYDANYSGAPAPEGESIVTDTSLEFETEEEAVAAGLPAGTEVVIGGRRARM